MSRGKANEKHAGAGVDLILIGILLALLGAGSVMLMVLGLSYGYVGCYGLAAVLVAGFALGIGLFSRYYGPYLRRLEARAPRGQHDGASIDRQTVTVPSEPSRPLPTSLIVALAAAAYGLLMVLGGLIWTRGVDLVLNLLAGSGLILAAAIVWWLGRSRDRYR